MHLYISLISQFHLKIKVVCLLCKIQEDLVFYCFSQLYSMYFVLSFFLIVLDFRKRYTLSHQSPLRSYISRHRYGETRYPSPAYSRRAGIIRKPGTCLFVAGFGFLTTERELERKFSRYGRVTNVRIIRDKR